ncbi:hypothetical protein Nepgr_003199 [Nepenthes gracilis]|uniref:Dof-type domain-containing protein n=1 Tax=Nepenthes gracilis TaxID=150966 RepID=A0AAD3RZ51_NEPGR|nr:hypothetical protein Nepgr_003199 [Nepenthes gracilis]
MLEIRDPAIKLFGKTIPVVSSDKFQVLPGEDDGESSDSRSPWKRKEASEEETEKEPEQEKTAETMQQDEGSSPSEVVCLNQQTTSETSENQKLPNVEKHSAEGEALKEDKGSSEPKNSQERILRKPDVILPCPRCNSMDTKFCYYNNYNVNQPRHFCKSCQRYWTAGGAMRNVPVGSGRRKNKSAASHYCQVTVSNALQAGQCDPPDGVHHPSLKTSGTILTFGSDTSLRGSMDSVLNLAEKKVLNVTRNGFHKVDRTILASVPCRAGENGDDHTSGSTVTTTSSTDEGVKKVPQSQISQCLNGFTDQFPCFPGFSWPYPWNAAVPHPAFCPSSFPMSFYPAYYWNGTIPWYIPWFSPGQMGPSCGPNSSTLGKHSRDDDSLKQSDEENKSGNPVLVPKTLRIDDPDEAAMSSIWTTLGIKKEKVDSISAGGFFDGFQLSSEEKTHKTQSSRVLEANPVALSRSISFRESV